MGFGDCVCVLWAACLPPGGLGMVGKVVSIQAWRKESAVSGGYIRSVKNSVSICTVDFVL